MTVAILVLSRSWGGLETHVCDLVRVLQKRGHTPLVACAGEATAALFFSADPSLPIATLPEVQSHAPWSLQFWRRELAALRCDAGVLEKGTLHAGTLGLECAARLVFEVFIATEHFDPPRLPPRTSRRHRFGLPGLGLWWYRQKWGGWLRSLAPQRTVCVGPTVRQGLLEDYGFAASRLQVMSNGIDLGRFPWPPETADTARRRFGIPPDAFVFGTVGRLVHDKGIDVALDAFARVRRSAGRRRPWLVVAGSGIEHEALEAQARDLGLGETVQFLGFVTKPALLYPALDAFLQPSRVEPQGITVLEALASGCEIIASDVGGIPGMISSPDLGTLVPPADPKALAEAMSTSLARNDDERTRRAAFGRRHVEEHYSAEQRYGAIVDLLESLRRKR